eukprot:TRINITY_DN1299_c0_g1_i1.p2 TRINITY_DN1299_c0_g1~~TRINITY_DN1299_c0_g1_i1.p2  ORF type:complete len:111 (-),score=6.48 TRINITY_DN1299_c0_g1_i1:69-401(-)
MRMVTQGKTEYKIFSCSSSVYASDMGCIRQQDHVKCEINYRTAGCTEQTNTLKYSINVLDSLSCQSSAGAMVPMYSYYVQDLSPENSLILGFKEIPFRCKFTVSSTGEVK